MRYYFIIFISLLLFNGCKQQHEKNPTLGEVNLPVSGTPEAQKLFKKGLLYLHSFEYLDANKAFAEAQKADKYCGMAYWGELMSCNHPLWQRQLKERADKVFNKLDQIQDKDKLFPTPLEKDLYESVTILYGEGTKYERDLAFHVFIVG